VWGGGANPGSILIRRHVRGVQASRMWDLSRNGLTLTCFISMRRQVRGVPAGGLWQVDVSRNQLKVLCSS